MNFEGGCRSSDLNESHKRKDNKKLYHWTLGIYQPLGWN